MPNGVATRCRKMVLKVGLIIRSFDHSSLGASTANFPVRFPSKWPLILSAHFLHSAGPTVSGISQSDGPDG